MARHPFKDTSVIAPGMYEGARLLNPRPGSYERLANKLMSEMDKRSFDPHAFAYLLSTYPEEVQEVLMQFVVSILNAWAAKAAHNNTRSDAEYNRCMDAQFIIDQIILKKGRQI